MVNKSIIIGIIVVLVLICLGIGLYFQRENYPSQREKNRQFKMTEYYIEPQIDEDDEALEGVNYIKPMEFKVGLIKEPTPVSSSLCDNTILFPVQQPVVDYGNEFPGNPDDSEESENCPCLQFIQAP